jgi:hypothetical protein
VLVETGAALGLYFATGYMQLETSGISVRGRGMVLEGEVLRQDFKVLHERELVFPGLRKSPVVFLLEAGCTDAEQSRGMVVHYARGVNSASIPCGKSFAPPCDRGGTAAHSTTPKLL